MGFETRIVRQNMPSVTHDAKVGTRGEFSKSVVGLVPPDESGEWRYREMQLMPSYHMSPSYTVLQGVNYNVPGDTTVPPCEILVVWERYEEEHEH